MTSEGTTLRSGNFPAPLLTEAAIAEARLSDVVLNPVKTLSAASETLGVSESVLNPVMTLPTTSDGTTLRSGNFAAPFLTEAAIAEARFCDVLLNPVKALITLSDTADTESSERARAPVKTLLATSEGTRVCSGNFPTSFLTEAAIAEARSCDVLRNPVKALSRASDTADTESSEIARAPVKTLLATSEGTRVSSGNFPTSFLTEAAIETTTDMDLATPLFTTPEIADARFSDVVLNTVKALDAASDKVGVSEIVLKPVKTRHMTSEGTKLRSGNFPAPFLTEAAIAEARLSDVLRNPVNALVTLSDIEDTELSEIARAPVNTLPTTSEGTTLRSGNFPAPLLTEAATETTSDRDLATPLFITSEIIDARFSDVVLNPVKTLDATSDTVGVSESVLNPAKTLSATSETETTSDGNTGTPLPNTSAIIDPRSSDVVLNPVKTLSAASETLGVSESVLNPLKTLSARSEGATASERKLKVPLFAVSDIREARFSEISLAPLKTLATESATVGLSVSVLNPAKTLPTTSEGTTLSTANFPAPLLTESAIAEARFSSTPLNPVKSLDAISEMVGVSVRLLNPVKSLIITTDSAAVSATNFPADLRMLSVTSPAMSSARPSPAE